MKPAHSKSGHMLLCALLVVAGVALLATGVGGGAFLLLGCLAMTYGLHHPSAGSIE